PGCPGPDPAAATGPGPLDGSAALVEGLAGCRLRCRSPGRGREHAAGPGGPMSALPIEMLAAEFWERAGVPLTFPRDLEPAIPLAVPAAVVRLEDLVPLTVRRWFLRRGIGLRLDVKDRPLDGCIVAYGGRAVLFLAAGLAADSARVI